MRYVSAVLRWGGELLLRGRQKTSVSPQVPDPWTVSGLQYTDRYLSAQQNAKLVAVGKHTYGTPNVIAFDDQTHLVIGDYCSIASGTTFYLGGNHRGDWVTTYPFSALSGAWTGAAGIVGHPGSKGDIRVGNDVWLGSNCVVLSGITIGSGAIIGLNTVVSSDVPDYGIVVGNPGRLVKKRFDDDTIEKLLALAWWSWPEEKINRCLPLLLSADTNRLFESLEALAPDRSAADGA